MNLTRRWWLKLASLLFGTARWQAVSAGEVTAKPMPVGVPFGTEFPNLDSLTTGEWWKRPPPKGPNPPPPMDVPRSEVVAFALYTHERGGVEADRSAVPAEAG